MYPCQGSYCIDYELDGNRFSGALDTGSPFLIVDGTKINANNINKNTQKLLNAANAATGGSSSAKGGGGGGGVFGRDIVPNLEDTYETYASEEGLVTWKQGSLSLITRNGQGTPQAISIQNNNNHHNNGNNKRRMRSTRAGTTTGRDNNTNDVIFGIFRSIYGRGGSFGGSLIGLVKEKRPEIRPTLLMQTEIKMMQFDFPNQIFSLVLPPAAASAAGAAGAASNVSSSITSTSRNNSSMGVPAAAAAIFSETATSSSSFSSLLRWVDIIDVRKIMGAPVKHYVIKIQHLNINSQIIESVGFGGGGGVVGRRPLYAMIDTGSTGLYISQKLFYSLLRSSKGFKECEVANVR